MPAIAGLRGTGDWGADERPKDFREMILWLNPNGDTPITGLMSKMKKETTSDPEFSWWEEALDIVRLQVDGALLVGDTALVVVDGALNLKAGDLLLVERAGVAQQANYSNEIVRVTAVASDTAVTIARGQAGSTAAAIEDASFVTLIGSSYAEGTGAPDASTRNPSKLFNYTEIFKDAYEITNTARVTKARTGDPLKNDKKRKTFDHSTRLELSWLFGKRHEATGANGKPQRYQGGLYYFLANHAGGTRILVQATALSDIKDLMDDMVDVFDYSGGGESGGDERIVWGGNAAMNAVSKLAADAGEIQFGEVVKAWGMNFTRMVTPQGSFLFKSHPLLSRHAAFSNNLIIFDPPALVYRHMEGRDTKPKDNTQANDADSTEGFWLTEAGLEVHHARTMKIIGNLSYAAA